MHKYSLKTFFVKFNADIEIIAHSFVYKRNKQKYVHYLYTKDFSHCSK